MFFPFPPPRGTDEEDITDDVYNDLKNTYPSVVSLGDVNSYLRDRLSSGSGIKTITYFETPDHLGFVAVTKLEQIDERGQHLADDDGSHIPVVTGNFWARVYSTITDVPRGRFRLLMFFVTKMDIAGKSDAVTTEATDTWISAGCDSFPSDLSSTPAYREKTSSSGGYRVNVRVYEFVKNGASPGTLVSRMAGLPIQTHLASLKLKFGSHN